jgi:hypothetical protein
VLDQCISKKKDMLPKEIEELGEIEQCFCAKPMCNNNFSVNGKQKLFDLLTNMFNILIACLVLKSSTMAL